MILRNHVRRAKSESIHESKTTVTSAPKILFSTFKEEKPKSIHYIEFQTHKLNLIQTIKEFKMSPREALVELKNSREIFKKVSRKFVHGKTRISTEEYAVIINWPHRDGDREVKIILSSKDKNSDGIIEFFDQGREILTLTLLHENEIHVERNKEFRREWNDSDIQSLVNHFNEIIGANKIHYNYTPDIDDQKPLASDKKHPLNPEQIKNYFSDSYKYSQITYRVQQSFLTQDNIQKNQFDFYLDWTDSQKHHFPLHVTLSRDNPYDSYFASENTFLKLFYPKYTIPSHQVYYNLSVRELNDNEVIQMNFTTDCQFGELYNIDKGTFKYKHGTSLSGNEVLKIYNFFDEIIPIQKTMICDASKLPSSNPSIKLYLRLLLPIINGKTWYESKLSNISLFECKNIKVRGNVMLTQNLAKHSKIINELQHFQLRKWFKMLTKAKQKILLDLFAKYFNEKEEAKSENIKENLLNSSITLQQLTKAIYEQSKTASTVSNDLINLTYLLSNKTDKNGFINPKDINPKEEWVSSRIHELLWDGYYWIRTKPSDSQKEQEEKSEKRLRI